MNKINRTYGGHIHILRIAFGVSVLVSLLITGALGTPITLNPTEGAPGVAVYTPTSITPAPTPAPGTCLGDITGDSNVNSDDFVLFATAYNSASGDLRYNVKADMNNDGVINSNDFVLFAWVYEKSCTSQDRATVQITANPGTHDINVSTNFTFIANPVGSWGNNIQYSWSLGYEKCYTPAVVLPGQNISQYLKVECGNATISVIAEDEKGNVANDTYSITVHENAAPTIPTLVTKQETIGLDVLQSNNISLENLTVSTLLSEDVLATGDTTANVTVADADKGQIVFISNPDGNPFVVTYISASDIQNGTTNVTSESIADGFIMANPLMFGFKDSDRLAILAHAKNAPLYQELKNEINVALQTEPDNLLEEAIFPKTYGDATLLIINAIKSLGGEALAQAVIKEASDATSNAIIGQTNVPHLNDLGDSKIEAINPTMIFYGFNIAEQPGQARVIAGKDYQWDLKLGWPPKLQLSDPVKETVDLGENGRFTITFSKANFDNAAGIGAFSANILKTECIALDAFLYCPVNNTAIKSTVERGPLDSQTLSLIGDNFFNVRTPYEIYYNGIEILSKKEAWNYFAFSILGMTDIATSTKYLIGIDKFIKNSKNNLIWVDRMLTGYDAANQYLPFAWDIFTQQNDIQYCVTETNGVLSATCQMIAPTAIITLITPPDQIYAGKEISFDSSSSSDPIYSTSSLLVMWDFDNDGTFDTDWSTNKTALWTYSNEGMYDVALQVKNQDGSVGKNIYTVIVDDLSAGGTATHIKAFRDVLPWNTTSFETTMANNGFTEGKGEKQYEILPSTALATNILTPGKDFVVIMNDQDQTFYNNLAASLLRLDRFIQNGGSVLWEASDLGWHNGSMATAGIQVLPGGVQFVANYDHYNSNVNPTSTLMNGLPDVLYGYYASHEYFLNLPANATIHMKNTADYPTLNEYRYGNGWVMLTGQPLEYNVVYNPDSMGLIYPRLFNYVLGQQVANTTQQKTVASLVNPSNQATQNVPSSHKEN